jgi:hypothetical protein
MSTLRLLREVAMFVAVVGGAALGYAAGQSFESGGQLVCAFVGMGAFGAFADICLRGGKN